ILSTLIGSGATDAFSEYLPEALDGGLSPVALKETIYQATDYLGYGRVCPFLKLANEILTSRGVALPLPKQGKVTREERLTRGVEVQAQIFGERMKEAWKAGTVNRFLAENCFGDYYTRGGLTIPEREMITFCFLLAQGGCEPQILAHAKGNLSVGNDADFLTRVVLTVLPYIGYPRSLNALSAIAKAREEKKS
ncbi:MAG TPA: carboxymuconolactone decarboxylase, partial [Clostridiales bacterium]|nr:carboxymuconolactone decarboxylase [Clostridiales bacterium]